MKRDPLENAYTGRSPCLTCAFKALDKNLCAPTCSKLAEYQNWGSRRPVKNIKKRGIDMKKRKQKEVTGKSCDVIGCNDDEYSRNLCRKHYDAWRMDKFEHPTLGKYKRKYNIDSPTLSELSRRNRELKISLARYPKVVAALREIAGSSIYPLDYIIVALLADGMATCCKDGKYSFDFFRNGRTA